MRVQVLQEFATEKQTVPKHHDLAGMPRPGRAGGLKATATTFIVLVANYPRYLRQTFLFDTVSYKKPVVQLNENLPAKYCKMINPGFITTTPVSESTICNQPALSIAAFCGVAYLGN